LQDLAGNSFTFAVAKIGPVAERTGSEFRNVFVTGDQDDR